MTFYNQKYSGSLEWTAWCPSPKNTMDTSLMYIVKMTEKYQHVESIRSDVGYMFYTYTTARAIEFLRAVEKKHLNWCGIAYLRKKYNNPLSVQILLHWITTQRFAQLAHVQNLLTLIWGSLAPQLNGFHMSLLM